MIVFAPSDLCRVCGGSGKDPPGNPLYAGPTFPFDAPVRQVGWQWTLAGTAKLDKCWERQGTGKTTDT